MSPLRSPVQTPLNLFLPVRRGDEGALENLLMLTRLREPNPIDVALRRLGNVHFAQFVMIPMAPPAGVPDGPPPQSLAVLNDLDSKGFELDRAKVNPNGGAIALGHPLGASGARLVTTAVNQLHRSGGRYALCTMCIGVGQGIAVVLERS